MQDRSDTDLAVLAKAGHDDRPFAELVRRHQARLRAFLLRIGGNNSSVDDIAQLTFLKAHGAIAQFRGGASFRSWLFAIAYREFLQHQRRETATQRIQKAATEIPADATTKTEGFSLDIRDALGLLPQNERACLLMCDAIGFSHAEASNALDLPLGSVKTYIARARKSMRNALGDDDPQLDNPTDERKIGTCHAR